MLTVRQGGPHTIDDSQAQRGYQERLQGETRALLRELARHLRQ